jgi:hypothetical protein
MRLRRGLAAGQAASSARHPRPDRSGAPHRVRASFFPLARYCIRYTPGTRRRRQYRPIRGRFPPVDLWRFRRHQRSCRELAARTSKDGVNGDAPARNRRSFRTVQVDRAITFPSPKGIARSEAPASPQTGASSVAAPPRSRECAWQTNSVEQNTRRRREDGAGWTKPHPFLHRWQQPPEPWPSRARCNRCGRGRGNVQTDQCLHANSATCVPS